jgi:hypothetical protein
VRPRIRPISVFAASPSSETSSGMVSSWPSTKSRPTGPRARRWALDRGKERGAVTAVHQREAVLRHCSAHRSAEVLAHRDHGCLVDERGGAATAGIWCRQRHVARVSDRVRPERAGQTRGSQGRGGVGLVAGAAVAVEGNPDELDVTHTITPLPPLRYDAPVRGPAAEGQSALRPMSSWLGVQRIVAGVGDPERGMVAWLRENPESAADGGQLPELL